MLLLVGHRQRCQPHQQQQPLQLPPLGLLLRGLNCCCEVVSRLVGWAGSQVEVGRMGALVVALPALAVQTQDPSLLLLLHPAGRGLVPAAAAVQEGHLVAAVVAAQVLLLLAWQPRTRHCMQLPSCPHHRPQ
jgi:hypothetical protein